MNRLTILPGLRRLWRQPDVIQLGVDPATATVLELPGIDVARVLTLLDGTRHERAVLRDAAALGVTAERTADLLAALRHARVLVSADAVMPDTLTEPTRRHLTAEAAAMALMARTGADYPDAAAALRRRRAASIVVTGAARLAVPVACTLAASGIGHIDAQLRGRVRSGDISVGGFGLGDLGRPRATAAGDAIRRASPAVETRTVREGSASFVVQIGQRAPAELAAYAYARRGIAHLLIEERDAAIVVGPLVPPAGSPCLHCLDLHRRDNDPAWPALVAQIATSVDETATTAASTVLAAVGIAVGHVLAYIDEVSDITVIGGSIEITPPATIRRRGWAPHPRCDCGRRRPATQRASGFRRVRVGQPIAG